MVFKGSRTNLGLGFSLVYVYVCVLDSLSCIWDLGFSLVYVYVCRYVCFLSRLMDDEDEEEKVKKNYEEVRFLSGACVTPMRSGGLKPLIRTSVTSDGQHSCIIGVYYIYCRNATTIFPQLRTILHYYHGSNRFLRIRGYPCVVRDR